MPIEIFKRREQKYVITLDQYYELIQQLAPYTRVDKYGENGEYTVSSLYFESPDHTIYYETKNKLKFRQKLRLRVYNNTELNGTSFFEVKQKHKKVVNKRRMVLPLSEAYRYLDLSTDQSLDNITTSNKQVLKEIEHFRNHYQLHPEMIVSYDRQALHGLYDDELRLTFDLNLRCRNYDLALEHGPYGKNFIDPNIVILEVKVNDSIPLWLTRILQELNCEQRGASKFCTSIEFLADHQVGNLTEREVITIGRGV